MNSAHKPGPHWLVNRSSIWVDADFRAVFAREDTQYDRSGRAPAEAIRACNKFANPGYDGTIVSQNAMKPGGWKVVPGFEQ